MHPRRKSLRPYEDLSRRKMAESSSSQGSGHLKRPQECTGSDLYDTRRASDIPKQTSHFEPQSTPSCASTDAICTETARQRPLNKLSPMVGTSFRTGFLSYPPSATYSARTVANTSATVSSANYSSGEHCSAVLRPSPTNVTQTSSCRIDGEKRGPAAAYLQVSTAESPVSPTLPTPSHTAVRNSHHHYINPLVAGFSDVIGPALPCRYRARRAIGRGAYSTVWMLVDNETGETVVGKLSDLGCMTEHAKAFARSEAVNTRASRHPNIIRHIETFERNDKLLHILEYADAGDLLTQVETRAKRGAHPDSASLPGPIYYQESEVLVIFTQLCLAVCYIHDRRIIHRDLKTPNVMLTKSGLIKLGDFGFSRQYDQSISADVGTTFCGTPYYLAPELWQRQQYSYKADIWSLGVILYELLALKKPFPASDLARLMDRVLRQGSFDETPLQRYSQPLMELVHWMLRVDPSERPSIHDILSTPLMQERGLPLFKINVRRLKSVDETLREQLTTAVDNVLGS